MAAYLEIENLTKSYTTADQTVCVLKGINCSLSRGEMCVLLGPSGSGKSTFLNLVGGLEAADSGKIVVAGTDILTLDAKGLAQYRRREIGFVFQFYNLIPDLTIRENIEVCKHISPEALDVDELLHSLGLWDQRSKFPREVSGGQQQRCAIGRALVKKPGLLLCDEPTGALDYATSKEILKLIDEVNRTYGCTVIIVTHNDAICHMSDRILRLHDGCLASDEVNASRVSASELNW